MKKMSFEQMEVIHGGDCFKEGAVVFGSAILSFGTTGFTAGLSWGLTALAYVDYLNCKVKQMEYQGVTDGYYYDTAVEY